MRPLQSFTAIPDFCSNGLNTSCLLSNQQHSSFHPTPTSFEGAGLAHDVGNLLGALTLYAELLASPGVLSKEYRSYAEEIKILADRSNVLIERLAGYRRVSTLDSQKVVLPLLIKDYRGLLTKVVGRPIEVSIGPLADKAITVPKEVVERVLLNLTKNAAAATLPSGCIRVTVTGGRTCDTKRQGYVLLTVTDDGRGMSREKVQAIFDSAPSTNGTGRGFGLQIVRELVEESEGHLDIQSYPGRGTQVFVKWFTHRVDAA